MYICCMSIGDRNENNPLRTRHLLIAHPVLLIHAVSAINNFQGTDLLGVKFKLKVVIYQIYNSYLTNVQQYIGGTQLNKTEIIKNN